MAEAPAQGGGDAPKKDLGALMGIVFAVVNLAVVGLGAYLVYASTIGHTPKKLSEQEATRALASFEESLRGEPVLYTMESLSTNLDGVPRRLIRVELSLEMLDEEGFEEVIGMGAETRDSVVHLLNSKVYNDLETVQGKLHLKNEIITTLNGFLKKGVVKNVYFNDFVVQ